MTGNETATVYLQLIARKYRISNNLLQDTKNFRDRQINSQPYFTIELLLGARKFVKPSLLHVLLLSTSRSFIISNLRIIRKDTTSILKFCKHVLDDRVTKPGKNLSTLNFVCRRGNLCKDVTMSFYCWHNLLIGCTGYLCTGKKMQHFAELLNGNWIYDSIVSKRKTRTKQKQSFLNGQRIKWGNFGGPPP